MRIAELWRYPIKSMAGERLAEADLSREGIAGDRLVQVYDPSGRMVTSRTRPRLLGLKGTLGPDGVPLVDGRPWSSPEAARAVLAAAGAGTRMERSDRPNRFDVLPLMVSTREAVEQFGADGRRFRPNLVIAGADGLEERTWPGRRLRAGAAIIGVQRLRPRCVMTTFDPDTQAQDVSVLRRIQEEYEGAFALDCFVVTPGRLAVGDPVALL